MKYAKYTKWFVLGSLVVILGYDAFVAFGNKEKGDTISALFNHWFGQPFGALIPVGIGVLIGHWFWPLQDKAKDGR